MANVQAQFGFRPFNIGSGRSPTYGLDRKTIAYNYTTALFRGDPVMPDTNGNIVIASGQTAPICGVFWGCEFLPGAPLTALPRKQMYWPGVALPNANLGPVTAWVITDPEQLYLIAELGSTAALTRAAVNANAQWNAGAGGNTATGLSSFVLDDGAITTTVTLPIKILDLYATYAVPGENGADASLYNWAVVQINNMERAAGRVGI